MPRDSFGREINYLRISLTSQCNLRCLYCMPLTAVNPDSKSTLLKPVEIELIARAAASIGFRRVRLTGGEPTLRQDLLEIIQRLKAIDGLGDLSMTTNGILLPKLANSLKRAGLARVNIHLDSLHQERLPKLMRFATHERIWAGIEAAEAAGLAPLKINAVLTKGFNETDTVGLAQLTLKRPWHVRFIELMPLGGGPCADVARRNYYSNEESKISIEEALGPLTPIGSAHPSQDSVNFRLPNAAGTVGFISPVSQPFCQTCNRMRVTSEGRFHLCLLNDDEIDARPALRSRNFSGVAALLSEAVRRKPTGHRLDIGLSSEHRQMFQLGG